MKVFKAQDFWIAEILETEIEGWTDKFVKLKPELVGAYRKREIIDDQYHCYCQTRDEAKQWLLDRAERRLESLKQSINKAEEKLEEIKKL